MVCSFPAEVSPLLHRSAVGFAIILPPLEHVPSEVNKDLPNQEAQRGPETLWYQYKKLQYFVFIKVSQVNSLVKGYLAVIVLWDSFALEFLNIGFEI